MNSLTLKHLRYFAALAKYRHFAKAADVCAISQPALSLQIKQLEEIAGAPLVERNTRNVQLTALGKVIAERAIHVLQDVDEIGDTLRAARDELAGPFHLGVIPTIAPYLLPTLFEQMAQTFPKLDLVVREATTAVLVEELQAGSLDAAIVALPISEPTLKEARLFTESFVLVRPKAERGRPLPDFKALSELRLLLLEEGHCFRDQALAFCAIDEGCYRNIMDGSSLTTLVQLVAAGVGITLIPEMARRVETSLADVDVVSFPDPQPKRIIGMVWRKTSPLEDHLVSMSEVIRTASEALYET
ncbi:MAG: LysR substrate-binding domain-containing protein [Geminicoccaceae bacterium]